MRTACCAACTAPIHRETLPPHPSGSQVQLQQIFTKRCQYIPTLQQAPLQKGCKGSGRKHSPVGVASRCPRCLPSLQRLLQERAFSRRYSSCQSGQSFDVQLFHKNSRPSSQHARLQCGHCTFPYLDKAPKNLKLQTGLD